jgi:rod shape determining protein RodA
MPVMWIFIMHDYQRERVMTLLNRAENIQEDGWQVSQSRIAIGSGEWFGKGYLRGAQVQNGFVPEHENDFVFTHHGEQFGFVGSVALIAVYAALILWALRIASRGRDRFAVLTATGIAAFIFWHVFVNLAMVMGLLPVVGLWLPLCSYGGSAMITVMGMVGILMSISIRRDVRV